MNVNIDDLVFQTVTLPGESGCCLLIEQECVDFPLKETQIRFVPGLVLNKNPGNQEL